MVSICFTLAPLQPRFSNPLLWIAIGPLVCSHCNFGHFKYEHASIKFLGPLSEIYGRSRVLQLSNLFYLGIWFTFLFTTTVLFTVLNFSSIPAWNLGCGFAQNANQLIAFRFLSGIGGSAPLAVRAISLWRFWSGTWSVFYIYRSVVVYSVIYGVLKKEEEL